MRNKFFKLFLVLMLMISVLAVNTNPIFAGGTNGLRITSGVNYIEYEYKSAKKELALAGHTVDNIEGLIIDTDSYVGEEKCVTLELTKDTYLVCSNDYDNVIESKIPLIITSHNEGGSNNVYTLYVCCNGTRQNDTPERKTGIECEGSLYLENVNIVFFPELQTKDYLVNIEDEYRAIYVSECSYEGFDISTIILKNSDLTIYGTKGVSNSSGDLYLNDSSNINMTIKTPKPEYMSYYGYDGSFIELNNGGLDIMTLSSAYVSAVIPDQSEYSNPIETIPYIEIPLIICPKHVYIDSGAKLEVYEPNHHFFSAIGTSLLEVYGDFKINGGVYGVSQVVGGDGTGLQAAAKQRGYKFYNANFEITSLLAGLNASRQPGSDNFPVSITKNETSTHIDFIKVIGDVEDAAKLELSKNYIAAIAVYNNEIFSSDILTSNFRFVTPSDINETDPSEYSQIVDPTQINNYKEIAIVPNGPQPIRLSCLNLTSNMKRATYYPDEDPVGDISYFNDAFDIEYSEDIGFTINVKKDFDFKFQTDEPSKMFISCLGYGLHIVGNNHTLSFTTNSEGSMITAPISCITFSSLFDSSISNLNIKLDAKDSATASNITYLFVDQGLAPRLTSLEGKPQNAAFDVTNVHINADSSSPLFEISNSITTIDNSSIIYNYRTPLFVPVEQQVNSVIESFRDTTIKNSNIEVYGNLELDKTKAPQMAIAEVNAILDITNCNIKGNGIDLGIGANTINIEDSNLDIYTNRGGLVGYNSISIKLSDGYHCNVSSKAASFDSEKLTYPAIFSITAPIFKLPEGCVFKAKYANGTEEEYNPLNSSKYESVSITTKGSQEEEEEHHHHHGGYVIPSTGIK